MKKYVIALVVVCVAFGTSVQTSFALPQFKKAFEEKYTAKTDDEDFKKTVKKTGCNVCHVKGEKKDVQNPYGKELNQLIEGDAKKRLDEADDAGNKDQELEKLLAELEEAFKGAEKKKSPTGELYGDLLKAHKLPYEPQEEEEDKEAAE